MVPRQLAVVGVVGCPASKPTSLVSIHHRWQPAAIERRRLVGFGFAGRLANCISQGSSSRGSRAGNLVDAGRWVRSAKADVLSRGVKPSVTADGKRLVFIRAKPQA